MSNDSTELQDKIYLFAAKTFQEADRSDQMGEAMYAFVTALSTQIDFMSANVEGVNYNYTQVTDILKEQIEAVMLIKATDPEVPSIH